MNLEKRKKNLLSPKAMPCWQICGDGESGGGDGGNVGDGGCGGGDKGGIQRGHDRWCCRCGREDVVMVHVLSFAHAAQIVVRDASQRVRVAGFCCSQRCRARCCSACEARSPIACCGAAPLPASANALRPSYKKTGEITCIHVLPPSSERLPMQCIGTVVT